MKKLIFFFYIGIFILSACSSDTSKIDEEEMAKESAALTDLGKTLVVPWNVELNDSTKLMEIRKNPEANMINLEPIDMVDAINFKYPQIKLEWVKLEGKRAFVKIEDARYLTSESGTEGANAYLAEVTFSLTEFKGIEEVDFTFQEGDHARPGLYTRESFKNFN
ncbi:hypothetical protein [Daejeonella sp.]|jgi:hypothetical protein|uniref:hypothetical protein n=1 Tax=Daejeonella sp. TaxID=2805397 RepID=UPI003782D9AA